MWNNLMRRWMEMAMWWLPKADDDRSSGNAAPSTPTDTPTRPASVPEADAEPAPAPAPEPEPEPEPEPTPEPEPEPAKGQESEAPTTPEAPAGEPDTTSDDLTAIRGIGPAMQKRLVAMGIRTRADLAAADVDTLTERLKTDKAVVSRDRIKRWIETAGG